MSKKHLKLNIIRNNYYPKSVSYDLSVLNFANQESLIKHFSEQKNLLDFITIELDPFINIFKQFLSNLDSNGFLQKIEHLNFKLKSIENYNYHYYEEKHTITIISDDVLLSEKKINNYLCTVVNESPIYFYNFDVFKETDKKIDTYISKRELEKIAKKYKDSDFEFCILSEEVASGIIHEAIGHLLEEDYFSEDIYNYFRGKQFHKELTVIDDPTLPSLGGSYCFDDFGEKSAKNTLFRNGKFVKMLGCNTNSKHSSKGNGRAINYCEEIVTRQSNFYLDKGSSSDETILNEHDEYIYVIESGAGSFKGLDFELNINLGYLYKDGEKRYFKDAVITSNSIELLKNIEKIGNRTEFFNIECHKMGQWFYEISAGSPKLLLRNIKIIAR